LNNRDLNGQIHEANIEFHRIEAKYFEMLHPEIYNRVEQKRLVRSLEKVSGLISNKGEKVLDFGAGIGVITGKLLRMGYEVTAVDISKEMCEVLRNKYADFAKKGALHVVNSTIENVDFSPEEFDLITCYAVLHHLPDYEQVIRKVAQYLKRGGIIYLDHEASSFQGPAGRIARMYYFVDRLLNSLTGFTYFRAEAVSDDIRRINNEESVLADYWGQTERKIDHVRIECIFKELNFTSYIRQDYNLHRTRIFNPVFCIFKYASAPDVSCWIAKR
jgi:2-polyprenyl-3-methyl-5-hydroxy-6-metoxy-1,4-benzoquinol methylase